MPTIRQATPEDVESIHTLGQSVPEFSVNDSTVTFWPKDVLANAIPFDDVVILIAEENGTIAGFIIANYNHGLRKATVENVFVKPEKRGQDVGGKLLEQMLSMLSERGCEYVAALIPTDAQDAFGMYQRAGFAKGETFLWLDKTLSSNFES